MTSSRTRCVLEIRRRTGGNGAASELAARDPAWGLRLRSGHARGSTGSLAHITGDGGEEDEDVTKDGGFGGVGQAKLGGALQAQASLQSIPLSVYDWRL
jgi:hypothetical protein